MITTADFKKGLRILVDGDPYTIMESIIQTPSARGASSLAKVKIRNLRTGQVFDKTFRTGEKFDEPDLERRPLQYLYSDGEQRIFLDMESYEQVGVTDEDLGDDARYLSDGMEIPEELSAFKFARQKSKLAGTIRGSYFVIKGDY